LYIKPKPISHQNQKLTQQHNWKKVPPAHPQRVFRAEGAQAEIRLKNWFLWPWASPKALTSGSIESKKISFDNLNYELNPKPKCSKNYQPYLILI
jgi:hypothetical protein